MPYWLNKFEFGSRTLETIYLVAKGDFLFAVVVN